MTSYPGICATFLLVLLTISYGILNIVELVGFGQSTVRLDEIDHYYNDSYVFDLDKKPWLNVALGFTHYDSNPEPIDDLDYGEVFADIKTWGGTSGSGHRRINLRPCTYEELGLDKPDELSEAAKFYPAH